MVVNNEKGIVLMMVLAFSVIVSLSWLIFSIVKGNEEEVIQNEIKSAQAAYLAEAGIQQALWGLSQNWDWENWADNQWGRGGSQGSDADGNYYEWNGSLGDSGQNYSVKIRDNGEIASKIVSRGMVDSFSREIEVEIGSAFDFGLYSHGKMEFRSRRFTVSGANNTGYVYSKDDIIDPSGFLSADKITGNFTGGSGNFHYFPKEIPLPELWKTKDPQTGNMIGFEAKINGPPTQTTVRYDNDTGEGNLEVNALIRNKTRSRLKDPPYFRKIANVDTATNTITTEISNDNWADDDEVVLERIDQYESYWSTLSGELDQLNNTSYGNIYPNAVYEPGVLSSSQSFSNANFTFTPTVQFCGNTTFSRNIKIDGNAIFGRLHQFLIFFYSGETTISGNMVVNGNAYFFNRVWITGRLYVVGSVYIWDNSSYNWTCVGCGSGGSDIIVSENTSGSHGISITSGGGLFVRDGTLSVDKTVSTGGILIGGYCYVNSDVEIKYGTASWRGKTEIKNNNTTAGAFSIRNGSLEVGSRANNIKTDLEGKGRIIVAQNITLTDDLLAPDPNNPLFIASGGDFYIDDDIESQGIPFYGMVYAGKNASIRGLTRIRGGLMVVNDFSNPLYGGSINYPVFDKNDLFNVGFTNNNDFVRPLLWREAD